MVNRIKKNILLFMFLFLVCNVTCVCSIKADDPNDGDVLIDNDNYESTQGNPGDISSLVPTHVIETTTKSKVESPSNKVGRAKRKKLSLKNSKLKITLKKINKISGYKVWLSKSKKMNKKNLVLIRKITKKKEIRKSLLKIKLSKKVHKKLHKKVYVRVRAFKKISGKIYYGSWSRIKKTRL